MRTVRQNQQTRMLKYLVATCCLVAARAPALACDADATAIFSCEAAKGRKFIELCASAAGGGPESFLQYRFGSLDASGREAVTEFEFPSERKRSAKYFFGATYTTAGVYTQSIRFLHGGFSYSVFTAARGNRELRAGVEVRNVSTGKSTTVDCSERPRFYIHEFKGALQCDPETPIGVACIE
jgi:hypothetical protein